MASDITLLAERHIKSRIFAATVIAFGLLANYYTTYSLIPRDFGDYTAFASGGFFAVLLIAMLANGVDHLWSDVPGVRRLIGDESTVENRRRAQSFGFWTMFVAGVVVYAAALWFDMPGHKAAQLVVTLALAAAALRFAVLEQSALNGA